MPVQPMATMRSRASGIPSSKRWVARRMASHHSWGSCSAPPSGRRDSRVGSFSQARSSPCVETRPTLGPVVPRSTVRIQRSPGIATPPGAEEGLPLRTSG
jgi:hypothetical protein